MRLHRLAVPAMLLCAPALAPAAQTVQRFSHKDWSLVCDNTRHCQAAGYQAAEGDAARSEPVALVMRRAAGPGTPLRATLMVERDVGDAPLTVKVGAATVGAIGADREMTPAQLATLLPALMTATHAEVSAGKLHWTLSLAGMRAVLLKMDEWQGRLDTPGALARKGGKPESSALPPLPAPTLIPAPLAKAARGDQALLPAILKALPKTDCDADAAGPGNTSLYRLSAHQLLVVRLCGRFAYQSSYKVWIANAAPPYAPVAARLPLPDRGAEDEVIEANYDGAGVLSSYAKARGLGDCGEAYSWLWTAQGFALLSASAAPECRGFPGGVQFPTWVATRGAAR